MDSRTATQKELIEAFYETLFDEGQKTCFSRHAKGTSVTPVSEVDSESSDYKNFQYFSINAMKDKRADANVVCFRNILIENDVVSLDEQWRIIKELKLPWSTATFSGNKSIHFIISLETELMTRPRYDHVVKWIYKVLEPYRFDIKTKNPSRFSRAPGGRNVKWKPVLDAEGNAVLKDGVPQEEKYLNAYQKILFVNGRVRDEVMKDWLDAHAEHRPIVKDYSNVERLSETANPYWLSGWTKYLLEEGIFKGKRNDEFHRMAYDFIESGFQLEEALAFVQSHVKKLDDFPRGEIETTFASAYKNYVRRKAES